MKKIVVALMALAAFGVTLGCSKNQNQNHNQILIQSQSQTQTQTQNTALNQRKPITTDSDLIINIADITGNALFYPIVIDGTEMEVLAVKAPDGTIRTAFNTCQVCYGSGRGYFVQSGTVLVCQNCGNRYRMSQIEQQSGGCNPAPVFPANKTVTDTNITISADFLRQARGMFARWGGGRT